MSANPAENMSPWLGQYYDKDGNIHDIEELAGGGSSSSGWEYSYNEKATGDIWINGQKIYRKTIRYEGPLPATNGEISFPHNISELRYMINIFGNTINTTDVEELVLPYVDAYEPANNIGLSVDRSNITVSVASARAAFIETYITMEYVCYDR